MVCPDEDGLLALVRGQLQPNDRRTIVEHLGQCTHCRMLISMLGKTSLVTSVSPWAKSVMPSGSSSVQTATAALALPVAGDQVGRYLLMHEVGRGAMGVVYEAYDPELKREVALKLVHPALGAREMLNEAHALASLNHPNVVTVHDSGRFGENVYIVMELVTGQSLRHWLLAGPTGREIVDVFTQVATGLATVHDAKLVHRDVKPDNVVLDGQGRPRLVDFGFALPARPSNGVTSEQAAYLVGTPRYLAPEVAAGQHANALSDQFSFCVALKEALERAPAGPELGQPQKLLPAMARLVARGTQADPAARYPSMAALLVDLTKDPAKRRRVVLQVFGALAVLALAAASSLLFVKSKSQLCRNASKDLVGVWDTARRSAVESAVLATGEPFAVQTVSKVQQFLDSYAGAWVRQHEQACSATRISGDQSENVLELRMQCLSNRLTALRSMAQVLSEPSALLASKAVAMAVELPALSACADVETLVAEGPAALSEAQRKRVAQLNEDLSRARAMVLAARDDEAQKLLNSTLAVAEKERLFRVAAEAHILKGNLVSYQGAAEVAAVTEQAVHAAEAAGLPRLMASAWNTRALGLMRLAKFADARAALAHSTALLESMQQDHLLQGRRNVLSGMLNNMEGKGQAGLRDSQDAIAELSKDPSGHQRLSEAWRMVATAYDIMGDQANAVAASRKALELQVDLYGSEHPSTVVAYGTFATMLVANGDLDEGQALARKKLAICERHEGPGTACEAEALTTLAMAEIAREHYGEAIESLSRALDLNIAKLGPTHPVLANDYSLLSEAHAGLKHFAVAIDLARRALAILQKNYERGSTAEAEGYLALGDAMLAADLCASAEAQFVAATNIFQQDGEAAEGLGGGLMLSAQAQLCQKKPAGLANAERALTKYEKTPGYQKQAAALRFAAGRYLWSRGDITKAHEQATAAASLYRESKHASAAAEVEQWLAFHGPLVAAGKSSR